ncbi:uncharacterized protein KZ484_013192 [Pholidichthys leucotaenia]
MSGLLKELKGVDQKAAATLREADICTDAEIQCLSREDLNGLFPGAENLKLRRKIFDIILQKVSKTKPTNDVLKEVRNLVPEKYLRPALTGDGILVDYLCLVKDIKTQVNNVTTFFDVQIDLLEEGGKARSLQEPATDKHSKPLKSQTSISDHLQQPQVITVFLKKICEYDQGAASVLQSHGLSTDADIQSLTQKDLDDLFPEPKHFKLKRFLHQQKLIDIVLKYLRGFIPLESLNGSDSKTSDDSPQEAQDSDSKSSDGSPQETQDLGLTGEATSPTWSGKAVVFSLTSWSRWLGRGKSWLLFLNC